MTRETKKLAMQVKKLAVEISKSGRFDLELNEFDENFVYDLAIVETVLEKYLRKDANFNFKPETVNKYFVDLLEDYKKVESEQLKSAFGRFLKNDLVDFHKEYLAFRKACEDLKIPEHDAEFHEFSESLKEVIKYALEMYIGKNAYKPFPPEKLLEFYKYLNSILKDEGRSDVRRVGEDFLQKMKDFYHMYLEFRKKCEKISEIQKDFEKRLYADFNYKKHKENQE